MSTFTTMAHLTEQQRIVIRGQNLQLLNTFAKKFFGGPTAPKKCHARHYGPDGQVTIANHYSAIRVHTTHVLEPGQAISDETGDRLPNDYVSFDRLIPDSYPRWLELSARNLAELMPFFEIAAQIDKRKPKATQWHGRFWQPDLRTFGVDLRVYEDGMVRLEMDDDKIAFKADLFKPDEVSPTVPSVRRLNPALLLTALEVFKKAGRDVSISLGTSDQPVLFTDGVGIEVIVLPIRVAREEA